MKLNSAKACITTALVSIAAVVVFAYLWCTLTGTISGIFCAATLVFAALFVYAVNKLSTRAAAVEQFPNGRRTAKGRNAA